MRLITLQSGTTLPTSTGRLTSVRELEKTSCKSSFLAQLKINFLENTRYKLVQHPVAGEMTVT